MQQKACCVPGIVRYTWNAFKVRKLVKDLVILSVKKSESKDHLCLDSELLSVLDTVNPILDFISTA